MLISKNNIILNNVSVLVIFYFFTIQTVLISLKIEHIYLLFSSFLFLFFIYIKSIMINIKNYKVLFFLILYINIYFIYYYLFPTNYMTTEVHIFQAKVILYAIFNILLAKALFDNFENKNLKIVILISLLISFLLFILNFNIDNLKYILKHQLLGGTLPFVGILTFVFIKDRKVKITIATLVLIMLYFIHSRASFYSFIVVYTFFILKELGVKKSIYIFFTILAVSSILYFFNIIEPSKRMLGISQISQDGSFNERLEQFKYGIEAIKNNWFFGQYAGQVIFHEGSKYSAGLGSYMHNILSFYRQYGLVFFLIFSIYYLYLYLKIYLQFLKSDDEKIETSFYFGTLVLMYLLFFHAYDYPFIWFAFAFMNFVHLENKNKKYVKK